MNLRTNQKGFTIVELLIVIVVIAILAAISIASFLSVQRRARTSAGQSMAIQVIKKAQAHHNVNSNYPADYSGFANVTEAQLEGIASADLIVQTSAITSSSPSASTYSDGKRVTYRQCGSGTGAQIAYWDFQAGAAVVNTIGTGTC